MLFKGNKPIKVIKGDTYPYIIKFKNKDIAYTIKEIWFTSNALNIREKFIYHEDDNIYEYIIDSQKTLNVKPSCYYTYDVTIIFNDESVLSETGIPLIVVDKKNPLEEFLYE